MQKLHKTALACRFVQSLSSVTGTDVICVFTSNETLVQTEIDVIKFIYRLKDRACKGHVMSGHVGNTRLCFSIPNDTLALFASYMMIKNARGLLSSNKMFRLMPEKPGSKH